MIFINGYWSRITGFLGLSPGTPQEAYWNFFSPIFISSSHEFMNAAVDETDCFIDGSSLFGIDQYASDRYMLGFQYALEHYAELVSNLKPGAPFKFISHSEGGAFASGMADFLILKGQTVERMLFLSPREADAFDSPHDIFSIQIHFNNDPVCISKRINGVDVYCNLRNLDGAKASMRFAHGGTVKASTITKVQEIMLKLPLETNKEHINGHWTITETAEGFDYIPEPDSVFKK